MGKVICEVCGTIYPETASQCPICGLAKPENAKVLNESAAAGAAGGSYTYVKGGRFSTANVRKRNKAKAAAAASRPARQSAQPARQGTQAPRSGDTQRPRQAPKKKSSYTGLVITIILLLLAIIAVVLYIVFHFFGPYFLGSNEDTQPPVQPNPPVVTTSPVDTTASATVPCTGLSVTGANTASLTNPGETYQISVTAQPEGCTDTITYTSKNPEVATVTEAGLVSAVAEGSAEITITCGNQNLVFYVTVTGETTAPTETTPPTEAPATYTISHKDVSINENEKFQLTLKNDATGEKVSVTWKADKTGIVSISGNTIKGLNGGNKTVVSTTIDGQTYQCIVRVRSTE